MRAVDCSWTDHIYSFFGDDGTEFHWNMTKAVAAIASNELVADTVIADLPESLYQHVLTSNGVEEQHLKTVTPERMEVPILLIVFPDDTHVVGDGNHRVVARWRAGKRDLLAYVVTRDQLEPYRVVDMGIPGLKEKLESYANKKS